MVLLNSSKTTERNEKIIRSKELDSYKSEPVTITVRWKIINVTQKSDFDKSVLKSDFKRF